MFWKFIRLIMCAVIGLCIASSLYLVPVWSETDEAYEGVSDTAEIDRDIHAVESFIGDILFPNKKMSTMFPADYLAREALSPKRNEKMLRHHLKRHILAFRLKRAYSEDELLQSWLSQVYLGGGEYGLNAVAESLFGKSAHGLSEEEAVAVLVLIASPSYLRKNPDVWQQRKEQILKAIHSP